MRSCQLTVFALLSCSCQTVSCIADLFSCETSCQDHGALVLLEHKAKMVLKEAIAINHLRPVENVNAKLHQATEKKRAATLQNMTMVAAESRSSFNAAHLAELPVDIRTDPLWKPRQHMTVAEILLDRSPQRPRRFGFLKFARKVRQRKLEQFAAEQSQEALGEGGEDSSQPWTLRFFAGLGVMGLITHFLCGRLQVEPKTGVDEDLEPVYGRPCWMYFCGAIIFFFSSMVFWMTAVSVSMVNHEIEQNPQQFDGPTGDITITRYPIAEPGKRAFEAGLGVAMSAAVACLFTFAWRWRGPDHIRAALLAQFALRGATLSGCIAMLLEYMGEVLLDATGQETTGYGLGNALMMLIVGASEEGAKLAAVVTGTWLTASALRQGDESIGCCGRCWRVLVETRRGLMLAGLAAGFGFMTMENSEYMMAVACTPPMKYTAADGEEEMVAGVALNVQVFLTLSVRIFLNVHPWLTALSAGRVGRLVFKDGRGAACPSAMEFIWAIYPSAVAHALFDYLVGGGGAAILGLLAVPSVWLGARWGFQSEWAAVDEDAEKESKAATT